jgi:hypothetical protein
MNLKSFKNASLEGEVRWAKGYLQQIGPQHGRQNTTCVDMAHTTISYQEGLAAALAAAPGAPPVTWVRVRRPAIEFARSASACKGSGCHAHGMTMDQRSMVTDPLGRTMGGCVLLFGFCGALTARRGTRLRGSRRRCGTI